MIPGNITRYAPDVEAVIVRVLGEEHALETLHEWVATQLARSRGADLAWDGEQLVAVTPEALAILEQALRDIAVYYRVGVEAFASMDPRARVVHIREAMARGGFGPRQ